MPERIQLRRTKGWRKPEGVIYVGRPSKWGNPFRPVLVDREWQIEDDNGVRYDSWNGTKASAIGRCVELYKTLHLDLLDGGVYAEIVDELGGRDLACWCPPDQPCHADILLEIANAGEVSAANG